MINTSHYAASYPGGGEGTPGFKMGAKNKTQKDP